MRNALLSALHSQLCSTRGLAVCFVLSNSVCYSNSEANFLKWTSLFLAYTSSLLLWYFCFKDYQWLWLFETHPFKTLRIETGNRWNLVSWRKGKKGWSCSNCCYTTSHNSCSLREEEKREEPCAILFSSEPPTDLGWSCFLGNRNCSTKHEGTVLQGLPTQFQSLQTVFAVWVKAETCLNCLSAACSLASFPSLLQLLQFSRLTLNCRA